MPVENHPDAKKLADFALGLLPPTEAEMVANHMTVCDACSTVVNNAPPDKVLGVLQALRAESADKPTDPWATMAPAGEPSSAHDFLPMPRSLREQKKYQILEVLGAGGMGMVYKAQHQVTGRLVALKVIQEELFGQPELKTRFLREARAMSKLDHPNVVRIYDVEQMKDLIVVVMEYLEGDSLAAFAQRTPQMPVAQACKYIMQAALGLQHAHDHGLVHRDIKPDNLRLGANGEVKVVDFGLVRYLEENEASQSLTGTNAILGTPAFMAPEQAVNSANASVQADLYALGCTLFCLLTGQAPFAGKSVMEILMAHAKVKPPRLQQWRDDVPPKVQVLLRRLLAKLPQDRPQKAAEVAAALKPFIHDVGETVDFEPAKEPKAQMGREPRGVKPVIVRRSKKWWAVASVGTALLAVMLAATTWLVPALIFRVSTPDGFIVLEIDQADAEVTVDDKMITIIVPGDNKPIEIKADPGKHRLVVSKGGFKAFAKDFELTTEKMGPIRVRLEPNALTKKGGPRDTPQLVPDLARRKPTFVLGGSWRVVGEELIQANEERARLYFGDKLWTDYDVSADARTISGPAGSGLLFRVTDASNYYGFYLGSYVGKWDEIIQIDKGRWTRDVPPLRVDYKQGHWYKMQVEVRGKQIRCFKDGQKLFEYLDARQPNGQIGLDTWVSSMSWKNLRVTAPDGKILWEGLPDLAGVEITPTKQPGKKLQVDSALKPTPPVDSKKAAPAPKGPIPGRFTNGCNWRFYQQFAAFHKNQGRFPGINGLKRS
jgi:hypothetical protein